MTGAAPTGRRQPAAARVLFLDFDGVLHPTDAYGEEAITMPIADLIPTRNLFRWTHHLADLLQDHPDVSVVVHSSWRHMYDDDDLTEFLGPLGHRYAGAVERGARSDAVDAWIAQHQPVAWLILDDHADAFPSPDSSLILCPSDKGVTADDVTAAISTWLETTATHAGSPWVPPGWTTFDPDNNTHTGDPVYEAALNAADKSRTVVDETAAIDS